MSWNGPFSNFHNPSKFATTFQTAANLAPIEMRLAIHRSALMVAFCCILFGSIAFFWAWHFPWFAPDPYLVASAWQYSALLSVPTAILILFTRQKKAPAKWGSWIILPLLLYFSLGVLVLWAPRIAINFADFPHASSIATVDGILRGSRTCGTKVRVSMTEYPLLSGFVLCVPDDFAKTLVHGDKLRLEGRAGLHGLSVDDYAKQ